MKEQILIKSAEVFMNILWAGTIYKVVETIVKAK
jgi:hypothetical protein